MLYSQLKGGLGNIFFIVALLKSLSIDRKKNFYISNNTQSCTKRNEETKWINDVLKSVKKVSKRPGEIKVRYNEKKFSYNPIPETKHGLELNGYFQSEKYFKHNKTEIIKLFTEYKNNIIEKLNNKLPDNKNTISIHIRRTDYLKLQHAHVVQDDEYYKNALEILSKKLDFKTPIDLNNEYTFVIFSDDIEWCKKHTLFMPFKNILFMSGNSAIEDLYLMSMCTHNIIANSTFSWWSSYLNTNNDKITVAPKKWFNPNYIKEEEYKDIYCEDWLVV